MKFSRISRYWFRYLLGGLILPSVGLGQVEGSPERVTTQFIREVQLSKDRPVLIPAHPVMSTTIMFPAPIAAPIGAFYISPEMAGSAEIEGDWYLEHEAGSNLLTIAPINDKSPPRNLNILFEGEVYVVIPYVTDEPAKANALVRLIRSEAILAEREASENRIRKETRAPAKFRNPSRRDLLAFMDEVKLLATLPESRIEDMLEETDGYTLSVREGDASDYGPFQFILNRVVRSPSIDALGFYLTIRNDSGRTMRIDPSSVFVRVGMDVYESSLSDVPTAIADGVSVPAFFVIYGNGTGGQAHVAPTNRFRVGARVAFDSEEVGE